MFKKLFGNDPSKSDHPQNPDHPLYFITSHFSYYLDTKIYNLTIKVKNYKFTYSSKEWIMEKTEKALPTVDVELANYFNKIDLIKYKTKTALDAKAFSTIKLKDIMTNYYSSEPILIELEIINEKQFNKANIKALDHTTTSFFESLKYQSIINYIFRMKTKNNENLLVVKGPVEVSRINTIINKVIAATPDFSYKLSIIYEDCKYEYNKTKYWKWTMLDSYVNLYLDLNKQIKYDYNNDSKNYKQLTNEYINDYISKFDELNQTKVNYENNGNIIDKTMYEQISQSSDIILLIQLEIPLKFASFADDIKENIIGFFKDLPKKSDKMYIFRIVNKNKTNGQTMELLRVESNKTIKVKSKAKSKKIKAKTI